MTYEETLVGLGIRDPLCPEEPITQKAAEKLLKNKLRKQNYTLDRAIEILKAQYEVSKKLELVNQPVAHALYQVWRLYDEFEPRRERK